MERNWCNLRKFLELFPLRCCWKWVYGWLARSSIFTQAMELLSIITSSLSRFPNNFLWYDDKFWTFPRVFPFSPQLNSSVVSIRVEKHVLTLENGKLSSRARGNEPSELSKKNEITITSENKFQFHFLLTFLNGHERSSKRHFFCSLLPVDDSDLHRMIMVERKR